LNSLWIVTNIPTPYRVYFFRALQQELKLLDISLLVSFMALTEKGRYWPYRRGQDLGFPYVLHRGIHFYVSGVPFHLNMGILKRAAFGKDDVTIVAGGWLYPSSFLVPLVRRTGMCLFWSESNLSSQRRTGILASYARRAILSRFDGFCIPNQRAYDWLKAFLPGLSNKNTISLPNLVDETLFSREVEARRVRREALLNDYSIDAGDRVFLCPVRLMERKGVRAFLHAIADLSCPNATILIAGDGPDRAQIETVASNMANIKARLLGFCDQGRMLDLYALADVFLLPSFQDPNPLSVIEACHAGLPLLISRRLGNYPETLREGENGWSFDPSDPASCREALERAVGTSPQDLKRMGSVSFRIANEQFCTAKTVNALIASLEKLSSNRSGNGHC
jgi:glycosyltransferase involved in cell wall biosynthesis